MLVSQRRNFVEAKNHAERGERDHVTDESVETLQARLSKGELTQKAVDGAAFFGHEAAEALSSERLAEGSLFTPPSIDRCVDIWGQSAGFRMIAACLEIGAGSYQAQAQQKLLDLAPQVLTLLRKAETATTEEEKKKILKELQELGQMTVVTETTHRVTSNIEFVVSTPFGFLLSLVLDVIGNTLTNEGDPSLIIFPTDTKKRVQFRTHPFVARMHLCVSHLKTLDGINHEEQLCKKMATYFLHEWKERA